MPKGMYAQGDVCPRGCMPRGMYAQGVCVRVQGRGLPRGEYTPMDRILDTRLWKHYLSTTTVADGNEIHFGCNSWSKSLFCVNLKAYTLTTFHSRLLPKLTEFLKLLLRDSLHQTQTFHFCHGMSTWKSFETYYNLILFALATVCKKRPPLYLRCFLASCKCTSLRRSGIYTEFGDLTRDWTPTICLAVSHKHYSRMFSVLLSGCNWVSLHGWFCPICVIHLDLIGQKSLHFEKK